MSDEEKKAIEDLKDAVNEPLEVFENVVDTFKLINLDQCRIVLNLIEKQQKEIEEKNIAINKMSKDISSQLEEIEEKSTIIMAGAEKVKQLEKEIKEGYHKGFIDGRISMKYEVQDKIRERIKEARKIRWHIPKLVIEYFEELLEE